MKFNKDIVYSKSSYFWIPIYYDKKNDIYFCEPESKEFVSKFYEKEYWDNFSRKKKISMKNRVFKIINILFYYFNLIELKYISDIRIIEKYYDFHKGKKILEIWSWKWFIINYFKSKWYLINWVEGEKEFSKKINSKHLNTIYNWNYEDIIINQKFDIIYLRHVLEHFLNLSDFINQANRNLNKDWIIYINIPNCGSKYYRNDSIYNHPHIFHFTQKSLSKFFKNNWYEEIHLWTYNWIKNNNFIRLFINRFFQKNCLIQENENKSEFIIWIFKKIK